MKDAMRRLLVLSLLSLFAVSVPAAETSRDTEATAAVRKVLAVQNEAWNRGDLEGFMQGYWKSDEIRFAGGDSFRNGWMATLKSYQKGYPDAAAMGKLGFDPLEVRELSPDIVYVFGKWKLTRVNEAPEKAPHGLFTLIFERKDGAWVITRDHSSAAGG
jgi:uncharacterized protein (TIGR02246 family)